MAGDVAQAPSLAKVGSRSALKDISPGEVCALGTNYSSKQEKKKI